MSSALINAGGSGPSVPPLRHRNLRSAPERGTGWRATHEENGFAPFKLRAARPAGPVDDLEAELVRYCATTTGDVVVDGSDLGFLDPTAVSILVDLEVRLRPLGRRLVLHGFAGSWPEEVQRGGLAPLGRLEGGRADQRG